MGKIEHLDEKSFDDFISKGNCIVDFYADWCGPCKMMAPEFDKAAKEMKDVKFGKVNVDGNQSIAQRFQVMGIPTVILFKDKEQVDRFSGVETASAMQDRAKKAFA